MNAAPIPKPPHSSFSAARLNPCHVRLFDEVFEKVESGAVERGIVPVENSLAGVIPETLDTFMQTNLRVVCLS